MHRKVKNNSTYPTLDICGFQSYHVYYQNEMEVYHMIIKLELTGNDRKKLAKAVSEIIGVSAEYQYMPTCAYIIGRDYTVTKEGNLEISDSADSKETEHLLAELKSRGYDVPMTEEDCFPVRFSTERWTCDPRDSLAGRGGLPVPPKTRKMPERIPTSYIRRLLKLQGHTEAEKPQLRSVYSARYAGKQTDDI